MQLGNLEPGDVFRISEPRSPLSFWEADDVFMVVYPCCGEWGTEYVEFIDRHGCTLGLHGNAAVEILDDDSWFAGADEVMEKRRRRTR